MRRRLWAVTRPTHTDAEALTGERVSGEFVVDTTPPVPGVLSAAIVTGGGAGAVGSAAGVKIHATFSREGCHFSDR